MKKILFLALLSLGIANAAPFVPGQVLTAAQLNTALAAAAITSGTIDGAAIGSVAPASGVFTSVTASSLTGSLSGTVTTASQPAITSVGTLSGLTVTTPIAGSTNGNVPMTAATGSAVIPNGTTAQRDVAPSVGYQRYNSTLAVNEYWGGSAWEGIVDAPMLNSGTLPIRGTTGAFSGALSATGAPAAVAPFNTSGSATNTAASGSNYAFSLTPTYAQTGTAAATDIFLNRTQTSVGSGAQNLIDLQVGGVSKFTVSNTGAIVTPLVFTNIDSTSSNSGQLGGFRNKLINGDFPVSQVNGNAAVTVTAAAALQYVTDQWYAYSTGANVTAQRIAGTGNEQYRYQLTGAASVTAMGFGQRIEQANSYHLAGTQTAICADLSDSLLTPVTWTAYYANTPDTFGTLAAPTHTQIATGNFTVNSTLSRYCATMAMPAAATTGIEIVFTVGAQTSGTLVFDEVQWEQVSATATQGTAFERVPYATQLAWAQRYLPVIAAGNVYPAFSTSATTYDFTVPAHVNTRVAITGVFTSSLTGYQMTSGNGSGIAVAALSIGTSGTDSFSLAGSVASGLTTGQGGLFYIGSTPLFFTGAQL